MYVRKRDTRNEKNDDRVKKKKKVKNKKSADR